MHHSRPFIGKKLSSCSLEVIYWIQNYVQVSEKLALGAKTAVDIEKLRDGYRPAAKRGAILFFVLAEMSTVNSMYQYSLASYLDVFRYSLRKSLPDSILKKRLKNIQDTLTYNVYSYGCTGKELQSPYVWWASVNVPMFETRYNVAIVSFSTLFALYKAIFFLYRKRFPKAIFLQLRRVLWINAAAERRQWRPDEKPISEIFDVWLDNEKMLWALKKWDCWWTISRI